MKIFLNLIITAAAGYGLTFVLSGVHFDGFTTAIVFAIILGILNLTIKPIISILGFPFTIITLGLFSLLINALVVYIADYLIDGMKIDGFGWTLIFSIALSAISSLLNAIFSRED